MMEWISVKDKLPKKSMKVLVFDAHENIEAIQVYICPEYGNIFWEELDGEDYVWTVTHWMPLPEPPKES